MIAPNTTDPTKPRRQFAFRPLAPLPGETIDAQQFGVVPSLSWSNAAATRRALQALVDLPIGEVGTTATTTDKTILLKGTPESWYILDRPVWIDQNNITIRGDGPLATRVSNTMLEYPLFIFGLNKNPDGRVLTAANFVDMGPTGIGTGPLKGQVTQKAWGLRTLGQTCLIGPATTGAFGPLDGGWQSVKQLRICFSVDFAKGWANGPLFGISNKGQPLPLLVRRQSNGIALFIKTDDGERRSCTVLTPNPTGRFECHIQVDLPSGTVLGFAKVGTEPLVQCEVNRDGMGADFVAGNHLSLARNPYTHFSVGYEGSSLNSVNASDYFGAASDANGVFLPNGGFPDFTLYALTISRGLRYADHGVGKPMARIDGEVETDYSRLYSYYPDIIWSYNPGLDPDEVIENRCVPFFSDSSSQCMLFLHPQSGDISTGGVVNGCSLEGMQIRAGAGRSVNVLWGHLQHGAFRQLDVDGGAWGLGAANVGANYPILIENCTLGGYEAAIHCHYGIVTMDHIFINRSGRVSMQFAGCSLQLSDWLVAGNGRPERIIEILAEEAGASYTISDGIEDWEEFDIPSQCIVYCEAAEYGPGGITTLIIDNLSGIVPATGVGVDLVCNGPQTWFHSCATFHYRGLNLGNQVTKNPVIRTDGPLWFVVGAHEGPIAVWEQCTNGPGNFAIVKRPVKLPLELATPATS